MSEEEGSNSTGFGLYGYEGPNSQSGLDGEERLNTEFRLDGERDKRKFRLRIYGYSKRVWVLYFLIKERLHGMLDE